MGFITAQILARVWSVKVNGWITMFGMRRVLRCFSQ
jgi:hypothetical protein